MKKYIYILLTAMLLGTGCAMLKREAERSVKKDVAEYFEDHFHLYAGDYHEERTRQFKSSFGWYVGIVGSILGIIAGVAGVSKLIRENKNKKTKDENSNYFDNNVKGKNEENRNG